MSAIISGDGRYRYWLRRDLSPAPDSVGEAARTCTFIMLNPSTADASIGDPTIRRCIGFARALGCAGIEVANLYGYRATDPGELLTVADPEGPDNDTHLQVALSQPGPVIVAWGSLAPLTRVAKLVNMTGAGDLYCLGTTQNGSPRHPLYLRADASIEHWRPNT